MRKKTEPTCTSLVTESLRRADDFLTVDQLRLCTGCMMNQLGAALHHLYAHKAVSMLASGGTTYWYATPDTDNRMRVVEQRVPEARPRKTRRAVTKK